MGDDVHLNSSRPHTTGWGRIFLFAKENDKAADRIHVYVSGLKTHFIRPVAELGMVMGGAGVEDDMVAGDMMMAALCCWLCRPLYRKLNFYRKMALKEKIYIYTHWSFVLPLAIAIRPGHDI